MKNLLVLKKVLGLSTLKRKVLEAQLYCDRAINSGNSPAVKFAIVTGGRTGSELLVDLLNSHPKVHCDSEILYHKVFFPQFWIDCKCLRSTKDIYGFKVKMSQLTDIQRVVNVSAFIQNLYQNGWKIIHLKRSNIFRQSISNVVAKARRGKWHHKGDRTSIQFKKVTVDCNEVIKMLEVIEKEAAKEDQALGQLPRHTIIYEEDLLNAANHKKALDKIFDYLGIESVPVTTEFTRMTSDNVANFIENYQELSESLEKTKYFYFLES